jgi:hypothetical protein
MDLEGTNVSSNEEKDKSCSREYRYNIKGRIKRDMRPGEQVKGPGKGNEEGITWLDDRLL